ncbi:MAG: transposase [Nitrospira sp.]|jgi:transposase InsO family protein|nr:transposase [Nitrospira sp.]
MNPIASQELANYLIARSASSPQSVHWFLTLQKVQLVIEARQREYNEVRTHSSMGNMTPMEFINHHHNQPQIAQELTSVAVV